MKMEYAYKRMLCIHFTEEMANRMSQHKTAQRERVCMFSQTEEFSDPPLSVMGCCSLEDQFQGVFQAGAHSGRNT